MISDRSSSVPIIEEQAFITKVDAITDHVRVRTIVDERDIHVEELLERGSLDIERIAVDREVTVAPPPRQEGNLLVISIIEERLVRRLFVVEEVRILQTTTAETVSLSTTLRSTRAVVERGVENDEIFTPGGSL